MHDILQRIYEVDKLSGSYNLHIIVTYKGGNRQTVGLFFVQQNSNI